MLGNYLHDTGDFWNKEIPDKPIKQCPGCHCEYLEDEMPEEFCKACIEESQELKPK